MKRRSLASGVVMALCGVIAHPPSLASAAPPNPQPPIGGIYDRSQSFQYQDQQHYFDVVSGRLRHFRWSPKTGMVKDHFGHVPVDGYYETHRLTDSPQVFVQGAAQHVFVTNRVDYRLSSGHGWGRKELNVQYRWDPGKPVRRASFTSDRIPSFVASSIGTCQHLFASPDKEYRWCENQPARGVIGTTLGQDPQKPGYFSQFAVGNTTKFNHVFAASYDGPIMHFMRSPDTSDVNRGVIHSDNWGTAQTNDLRFASFRGDDEHLFYLDNDGMLQHKFWVPGATGINSDSWADTSKPQAERGQRLHAGIKFMPWPGQEHVFTVGKDGSITQHFYDIASRTMHHNQWAPPGSVGDNPPSGSNQPVPAVNQWSVSTMHGQQHLWATNKDGEVNHWWWGPGDAKLNHNVWHPASTPLP